MLWEARRCVEREHENEAPSLADSLADRRLCRGASEAGSPSGTRARASASHTSTRTSGAVAATRSVAGPAGHTRLMVLRWRCTASAGVLRCGATKLHHAVRSASQAD